MRSFPILAILLLGAASLSAADTYSGAYTWLDMKPGGYDNNTLSLSLEATDAGHQTVMTATFRTDALGDQFKEPRQHAYSGLLTGDLAKGPIRGTVTDAEGQQTWQLEIKLTQDGRCLGIAKETTAYQTWAVFALDRQGVAAEAAAPTGE